MIRKTCVDCGKSFEITDGEVEFYRKKNYDLPKRCKECRDKKNGKTSAGNAKPAQSASKPAQSAAKPQGGNAGSNGGGGKKKLGITAAGIVAALSLLFGGNAVYQNANQTPAPEEPEIGYVTELEDANISEDLDDLAVDLGDAVAVVEEGGAEAEEIVAEPEAQPEVQPETAPAEEKKEDAAETVHYTFAKKQYLTEHFEKHGGEFDYANEEEYLEGANRVVNDPNSLHKTEKEDGDDVYFLESTGEFVVVSKKGFIRTYFIPSAGIKYYNRQ